MGVNGGEVLVTADGPRGVIALNRPQARNAITVGLARELAAGVRELAATVDVIVIRGSGGTFCAGGDVAEVARLRSEGREGLAELFGAFRDALSAIALAEVPVVAVVTGHAVAGGFELVAACDLVIAAESATFADIHARFGQVPGGGGTQRLPRLVGRARASALILTGDSLTARQAMDWGLVYAVAPDDELGDLVEGVLTRLGRGSRAGRATSKRLIRQGLELPLQDGLDLEAEAVLDHILGDGGADYATRKDRS